MKNEVSVKSCTSDVVLCFSNIKKDSVCVSLASSSLSASRTVYLHPNFPMLDTYFLDLAEKKAPWDGKILWEALEKELSIVAECNNLGKVKFTIGVYQYINSENWSLEAELDYDLGMLPALGKAFENVWKNI